MLDEESFLDFKCPHCGASVSFPQQDAGYPRACPSCMATFIVPTDGSTVGRELPLPLNTERLVLRRFVPGDWRDLLAIVSDEELFAYTDDAPLSEEAVLHWLEQDSAVTLTTTGHWFFLGLELKEGGKLIGYAGLNRREAEADLFIRVHRDFQKKAFALEAMDALLEFAFATRLHRVAAICDARNTAARKLLDRLGLRREGEFIKNKWTGEEWVNTLAYAALDEEWANAGKQESAGGDKV